MYKICLMCGGIVLQARSAATAKARLLYNYSDARLWYVLFKYREQTFSTTINTPGKSGKMD